MTCKINASTTGAGGLLIESDSSGAIDLQSNGVTKMSMDAAGNFTATSFIGNGSSLTGLNSDVVNDTTPQLGGNLDGQSNNITGVTTLEVTTVDLGDWTITESGGVLYFATGGTNKMKLDASGNLIVTGNVTAYGTV